MNEFYKCPVCGNTNQKYIGYKKGEPYCRRCITFKGEMAEPYITKSGLVTLDLKYSLSKEQ